MIYLINLVLAVLCTLYLTTYEIWVTQHDNSIVVAKISMEIALLL